MHSHPPCGRARSTSSPALAPALATDGAGSGRSASATRGSARSGSRILSRRFVAAGFAIRADYPFAPPTC
jgi:hypothetical protein